MSEEIEKAMQEVFAICKGPRQGGHEWRMSIPVNEARDSDVIIMAGLKAGAQAELERDMERTFLTLEREQHGKTQALLTSAEQRERAAVEGLDRAAYALFTLKRTAPDNVREIATVAHQAACVVLDSLNPALQP